MPSITPAATQRRSVEGETPMRSATSGSDGAAGTPPDCARTVLDSRRTRLTEEESGTVNYVVTGATGFIGRHLVAELLKREGTIYVLVREGSRTST
jgi:hypothetical protein